MDCPICREAMLVLELDRIEIDYCSVCSGIWLDKGELELLLESAAKKDELLLSFDDADLESKEKKRLCPICLKKMKKVFYGKEKGALTDNTHTLNASGRPILVDKCARGDGIWFDKGELSGIIQRSIRGKDNRVLNLIKDMLAGEFSLKKGV